MGCAYSDMMKLIRLMKGRRFDIRNGCTVVYNHGEKPRVFGPRKLQVEKHIFSGSNINDLSDEIAFLEPIYVSSYATRYEKEEKNDWLIMEDSTLGSKIYTLFSSQLIFQSKSNQIYSNQPERF